MQRRTASLWFPHLAAERALRHGRTQDPARPFAVTAMQKSALRLSSLNAAAAAKGLRPGMALTEARALLPGLASAPDRPERDAAFLRALARWALAYTPWVALDPPDGLVLDITGCAHLFSGEAAMLRDIAERLAAMRLTVRTGIADTAGAAWALSRFAQTGAIAPPGRTGEAVAALPVAALRIAEETAQALRHLGLRRIGDIAGMPRGALARRFGMALVQRLDRVSGAEPEPLDPYAPAAPYAVRLSLPEPIGTAEDVCAALDRLLVRLCKRLERDGRGACQMRLSIQRSDHSEDSAEIGLARPMRDPARIAALLDHAIGTLDAGFGIDALRLYAPVTEPMPAEQRASLGQGKEDREALGDLIAKLGNRIGFERVTRVLPADSHVPERAFTVAAAAYSKPEPFAQGGVQRPLLLFAPEPLETESPGTPPPRFRWRGAGFDTAHACGPERIAPEWWWHDPAWQSGVRDYWRVQTAQGRRLWLVFTPEYPSWFAAGEFA